MIPNTTYSSPSDKVIVGEYMRQSNRLAYESQFLDDTFDAMTIVSSLFQEQNAQKTHEIRVFACLWSRKPTNHNHLNLELKNQLKQPKIQLYTYTITKDGILLYYFKILIYYLSYSCNRIVVVAALG